MFVQVLYFYTYNNKQARTIIYEFMIGNKNEVLGCKVKLWGLSQTCDVLGCKAKLVGEVSSRRRQ